MFDPERLLRQMVGGALGGGLGGHGRKKHKHGSQVGLGSLLGGGGGHRGGGHGVGGVGKAQIGLGLLGVAMAAYEHYKQQGAAGTPPPAPAHAAGGAHGAGPSGMPPPPPPPATRHSAPTVAAPVLDARQQEAALLVRAMIAAAAADGHIDDSERATIIERARAAGDDADTVAWLHAELARPLTLEQLIAQTPVTLADEVYAASLLSIEPDHPAEHDYLQRLAGALRIDEARRRELQAQLGLDRS